MAEQLLIGPPPTPSQAAARVGLACLELTKPRITLMVVFTSFVGYAMAAGGSPRLPGLLLALLGTALIASGASALNMVMERRTDALMERTRRRPLPSGRLGVSEALGFGGALSLSGLLILYWGANRLATAVALVTWASYLFAYTPLKTRTSLATVVGAFPGALPPVIGWTAATGRWAPGALFLFVILFLWQLPHFLAIAWLFREDYARGGLPTLPAHDPSGRITSRQTLLDSAALLVVSLLPGAFGLAGPVYSVGALLLGAGLVGISAGFVASRGQTSARRLFLASVLYLPALLGLLLANPS
jgi:protoheme IX farnesyltransferase